MMTNAQLAVASLDDIVFDGRNQVYGAYQLRALYQRHMTRALIIATVVAALLLVFPLLAQLLKEKLPVAPPKNLQANTLIAPPLAPEVVTPPSVPAVKPPVTPPQPSTMKDVVPVVVEDKQAPAESEVPNQNELREKEAGLRTMENDAHPHEANLEDLLPGKDEGVVKDAVVPSVYTYVEQMPQLPGGGGMAAIVAAIQKSAKYPAAAVANGIEGKLYASFTVNAQGEITAVKIVKGLGYGLDEETIRAINTLPKFIPGKQNGREVSVSFTVPVSYKIQ